MPWQTEIPEPPAKPLVAGWFAIFNLLASQQIVTMNDVAVVIGIISALQSVTINTSAGAKGLQNAGQSFVMANAATSAGVRAAAQQFLITDAATLAGGRVAAQSLSIIDMAIVVGVAAALQSAPIASAASATGIQQGNQGFTVVDFANVAGIRTAMQQFTVTEQSISNGHPLANNQFTVTDSGQVIGLILSPQQFNMLNQGIITGSEAIVTGPQFVSIADAAIIKGIQAAGQILSIVDGATLSGKSGADQTLAITESGVAKGISLANVTFTVTTTGTVYARLTGAQSFTMTNAPASFYGKPGAAQSFLITNAATAVQFSNRPVIIGTPNTASTTSVALPTHAIGQLIIIFGYNGISTTALTKPGAGGNVPTWIDINNNAGANTNCSRTAYCFASSTTHTSGTWANASCLCAVVIDFANASPIGGQAESGGSAIDPVAPAITLVNTDDSSLELVFYGQKLGAPAGWAAAPTGYTRQATLNNSNQPVICFNTKDVSTSDGSSTQVSNRGLASGYRGTTIEIKAA